MPDEKSIQLLRELKTARPLLLYGDSWIDRIERVLESYPARSEWAVLISDAIAEAEKAMSKYPQPNYVITKIAEEAGELIKAAVHCAEGRELMSEVRAEMAQLIAMLYRLFIEGDQVHGLAPVDGGRTRRTIGDNATPSPTTPDDQA